MDNVVDRFANLKIKRSIGCSPSRVSLCANIIHGEKIKDSNCFQDGALSCGKCHLVKVRGQLPVEIKLLLSETQYCSKACQVTHWPIHKLDCNSVLGKDRWRPGWIIENRTPSFMGDEGPILEIFGDLNYLWGNIPAIDLLNLSQNEGEIYSQDLDLCLAGK